MSEPRTERTQYGLATYRDPTFRTYEPYTITGEKGQVITVQLCEELVRGCWRSSFSVEPAA